MENRQAAQTPQTPIQPTTPPKNSSNKLMIIFVLLIIFAAIGVGGYFLGLKNKPTNNAAINQIVPTATATQEPSPSVSTPSPTLKSSYFEDTGVLNQKRYVSPKLGVSFLYLEKQDDQTVSVKEDGNIIYVYMNQNAANSPEGYKSGQWVEVFQKDKNTTLKDTIKQQFLANYSSNNCFPADEPAVLKNYPVSFEAAIISYPPSNDPNQPSWANADKCPGKYTASNGISYFLMDKNHPDKFVFFSIGQYMIGSGQKNTGWERTLQFLD
ncbi:hypothetical protein M1349_02170 [Patescibacteria group bacterium]|nr:hypothetical protein [Patescibacteria group bacterium]